MWVSLSTNFAIAPNDVANDSANDLVMTGLVLKATPAWWMMSLEWNPFGTRRNVDRFQNDLIFEEVCQEGLHNQSRLHHFRWLRVALEYLLVNLGVHGCKVCVQFVVPLEPAPTLQPSNDSLHVFEVLLSDVPEVNDSIFEFLLSPETRGFARGHHRSAEFSIVACAWTVRSGVLLKLDASSMRQKKS